MTRQQFIDEVTWWSDLIGFCSDYNLNFCDNIYDEEQKNDYYDDRLCDMASEASGWQDLLETLNNIPDRTANYYYLDDYGDMCDAEIDEDYFDEHKSDILDYMDRHELWDEEEDEENEYTFEEELSERNAEPPIEDEDISISDLISSSVNDFQTFVQNAPKEPAQSIEKEKPTEEDCDLADIADICKELGIGMTAKEVL